MRSFPPHPNPLPPERGGHSSPQQGWRVFWRILIKGIKEVICDVIQGAQSFLQEIIAMIEK